MTDQITEAARATRRFYVSRSNGYSRIYNDQGRSESGSQDHFEALAACDRLNLLAVLEALREPSEGMDSAGHKAGLDRFGSPTAIWRAMIDAAIKEAAERRAVNAGETE